MQCEHGVEPARVFEQRLHPRVGTVVHDNRGVCERSHLHVTDVGGGLPDVIPVRFEFADVEAVGVRPAVG